MPGQDATPPLSFKLPTFMPTQAEIWVTMVEDAFTIHNISDNRRKMLEIRMALTQEVRALTVHLTTAYTKKLTDYRRKYGTKTDVQKMRATVTKRPISDKTPMEYLYALPLEIGTNPETLPQLKRIFEDSLVPHIAALIASENIADIDSYADRASELYILYEPITQPTVAKIATSEVKFPNEELLETLKALTSQVAALTTDLNALKEYQETEVNQLQPQASYRPPPRQ